MICSSCGNEIDNKDVICPYCGQTMRTAPRNNNVTSKQPVYSKPLDETSVNPAIVNYDDLKKKRKKQNQKILIVIICILVFILLVLVIKMFFANRIPLQIGNKQETTDVLNDYSEEAVTEELQVVATESSGEDIVNREFLFKDSDRRYLDESELENLPSLELRLALNEIYARRGFMFTKDYWCTYFNNLSWYSGTIMPDDFSDSVFNEYETANKDLIVKIEKEKGYR